MPLSLMVRLARLIRWAMVASGTRNAAAICAVVSPPTARRVSAIWLGRGQGRVAAAEQQGQRVVPVSARPGVGGRAEQFRLRRGHRDLVLPAAPGLLIAGLVQQAARGHRDQPAPRVGWLPLGRPLQRGGQQRFLSGVLAQVEVPVPAHQRAEDLRRQFAQQLLGGPVQASRRPAHGSGDSCRIGHSSTGSWSAHGMSAAICSARSALSQSSR